MKVFCIIAFSGVLLAVLLSLVLIWLYAKDVIGDDTLMHLLCITLIAIFVVSATLCMLYDANKQLTDIKEYELSSIEFDPYKHDSAKVKFNVDGEDTTAYVNKVTFDKDRTDSTVITGKYKWWIFSEDYAELSCPLDLKEYLPRGEQ